MNVVPFIGREKEFEVLKEGLERAQDSHGSTILISGEAGIGKTRLVEEFIKRIEDKEVLILKGEAVPTSASPFLMFSKALNGYVEEPLFQEQEHVSFSQIFAIDRTGVLIAQATPTGEEIDPDIFAGMFSAVQDFISDSFSNSKAKGLGRLDYGDMKILIEHGEHLFLTGILKGKEHPDMKGALRRTLEIIEKESGEMLDGWEGKMEEVLPIQKEIRSLAERKFLVRRELEGVKLENERMKIADRILEILKKISDKNTIILLLEDLHWSDESSLFVLQYLARNIISEKILIIGTLRMKEGEVLEKYLQKMREEETINEIKLEEMGKEYMKRLIDNLYPDNSFPKEFIGNIAEKSEGNPLFLIEFMRNMEEDSNIEKRDGKYVLASETYSVPNTLEEIVESRLENLDIDSMMLAEYASCIGREFEKSILISAGNSDYDAVLKKLSSSGIILLYNGKAEFVHGIFQEVIYDGIHPIWKGIYHRSIGEYYEREYNGREEEVIYELARHFSHSNEYGKAFDYSVKAGEKAESEYAVEEAIDFYKRALNLLGKLPSRRSDMKANLLERLGDLQKFIGNYQNAIKNYENARASEESKERQGTLLRKIAETYNLLGEYDSSLGILEKAEELGGEGTAEYGRMLLAKGYSYMGKGDYERAMRLFLEALKVAESTGTDRKDAGNALRAIGTIYHSWGEYDSALESFEKSLSIMEECEDRQGIARLLNNIGTVYYAKGNLDLTLEFHKKSLRMFEKIGDKYGIAVLLNNIGVAHFERGELDLALEFYEKGLEIKEKIGDKYGIAISLNNIGEVHYQRGELDLALEFYEKGLEMREKIGDKYGIAMSLNSIAGVHYDRGELDLALEFYEKALEIRENIGDKNGLVHSFCGLVETYLKMGNVQIALESAEKALKTAVEIGAKPEEGISHRVLGMVYKEKGDWERAIGEFENAIEIFSEIDRKDELARTFYEEGILVGEKGESTRAIEYLEKSLSLFEATGMKLWAEKCRKALKEVSP